MCELNSWFLCNRLSLNVDKTNFSVFGAGKSHINFELTIDRTNKLIHANIWVL